jgi:hypothetical protein
MQLVGDQSQHPLALGLGGVAAFSAMPVELFQLVVQVSHRVLPFR